MNKRIFSTLVCLLFVVFTATLRADITMKSTITSKGIVGLMNMEGTHTISISGEKAMTQSNVKMTSKVMKFLGAGKPQAEDEIIRVDKELIWDLNLKDKEYTEKTFAQIRADIEKGLKEAEKEKQKRAEKNTQDSIQLRAEVKVEHTGKSQKIAGYNADQTIITMKVYGKNAESNESGMFKVIVDTWNSESVPGQREFRDFYATMASKLGFMDHSAQSIDGVLTSFGIDPREMQKHMKDVKGVSLMSTLSIEAEADSTSAAKNKSSAKESSKSDEKSADEEKSSSKLDKLGGLFGKKNKDKETKGSEKNTKTEQDAPAYLVQFTTTVTEVSTGAVSASEFEIPAGFKKK